MSAAVDLKIVHDVLVEVAHEAGDMILAATPAHADTKKNSADIVTETDRAVEEMVSTRLRERFPDFE
jgi:myo-inositol-1(or 4)-monophosphatase